MVTIAAPNALHAQMTVDAANAGKHIVCEKPLCMTLEEADVMIERLPSEGRAPHVCRGALLHPKYVKAKTNGRRRRVRKGLSGEANRETLWSARAHGSGTSNAPVAACSWTWAVTASPSATGFWDAQKSRASLCHLATHVHADKTQGDDDSICIIDFEEGAKGRGRGQLGPSRGHGGPHRNLR
jgi:myo-inositol 2-dehydrogenase/D-chiro-inositol 1-dehydrogenase